MKKNSFIGIIPARYASTRFPAKPLARLGGVTVIERVYRQVEGQLDDAVVATDDARIYDAVVAFGGKAVMTGTHHKSGTDRVREAYEILGQPFDVIVNIQGDEPFIQPSQLQAIKACFDTPATQIATLVKPFTPADGLEPAEWLSHHTFYKHIGLYAYRPQVLREITSLPQSPLELAESLEQLRWLQAGYHIQVGISDVETIGIDTPEDLQRAEEFLKKLKN